jgi:hypothetical protein
MKLTFSAGVSRGARPSGKRFQFESVRLPDEWRILSRRTVRLAKAIRSGCQAPPDGARKKRANEGEFVRPPSLSDAVLPERLHGQHDVHEHCGHRERKRDRNEIVLC